MIDSPRLFHKHEKDWVSVRLVGSKDMQSVRASAVIGYCRCDAHRGSLTAPLLHSHKCMEKDCPFLERYVNYPYWRDRLAAEAARARKRSEAKAAKAARKAEARSEAESLDAAMSALKAEAQDIADAEGWPITVVRAAPYGSGRRSGFVINYVSADPDDDERKYVPLARALAARRPGWYEIRRVRLPDGTPATPELYEAMLRRKKKA